MEEQPNNPLHGITLETIVKYLVDKIGWKRMYKKIEIQCFFNNPSIKSSLKFLRQTPWAREKVENLYLYLKYKEEKKSIPTTGSAPIPLCESKAKILSKCWPNSTMK